MARVSLSAVFDGRSVGIRFERFDGIADVLRHPPFSGYFLGNKEHPYRKHWVFDAVAVDGKAAVLAAALARAAEPSGFRTPTPAQIDSSIREAFEHPNPRAFIHGFSARLYPLKSGGFVITSSFHRGLVWLARQARGKYVPACRGWLIPDRSPDLFRDEVIRELQLNATESLAVSVEPGEFEFKQPDSASDVWLTVAGKAPEPVDNASDDERIAGTVLATMQTFAVDARDDSRSFVTSSLDRIAVPLHSYQREGIRFLADRSSALLADDPGLGKTRQAIVAAHIKAELIRRESGQRTQIVIAAPASLLVNWQREIAMLFPDDVVSVRAYSGEARWLVCNFELLSRMADYTGRIAVMVVDEAHYLKETTAERTRLSFQIGAQVPVRYLLTGTPVLNREVELHSLLQLSGHPVGKLPLNEFCDAYAGSKALRNKLGSVISDWMLRRKKSLVLRDLKGRQEQVQYLDLLPEVRKKYQEILADAARYPLDRIVAVRQLLESARALAIEELADSLANDDKLIVFCEYKSTVELLLERLARFGVVSLTGEDAFRKRQKSVDAFQTDPEIRVLVGTTGAAATGLNLQAANYVTFASLPWTPALRDQAESRADRQGQTRLVISKIMLFKDTLDEMMWSMLSGKAQIASEIIDDERATASAQHHIASAICR